jgi:very-short-patch-repair endonuclease
MNIHYPHTGHLVELTNKNRANPTKAEQNFILFCERMNIQYEFQVPIYCDERGYILDFDLCYTFEENGKAREIHYVVEIDGEYHKLPEQQAKDRERTQDILQANYKKVIRIPNKKTYDEETLFNALYKGIPKDGKFGPAFRNYIQQQKDRRPPVPKNKKEASCILDTLNEMKEQIIALQEQNDTLNKANWYLAKEVYDTKLEVNKWKEKLEEVNRRIWQLSVATGNYNYYRDDYAVDF